MTRCALCGHQCIPMADYDIPVCVRCDNRHEQALARLNTPQHVFPARQPIPLQSDQVRDLYAVVHILAEMMAAS